jgi:hypothetical protein
MALLRHHPSQNYRIGFPKIRHRYPAMADI